MLPLPNNFNTPRNLPPQPQMPAAVRQSPVVHYSLLLLGLTTLVFVLRTLDSILLPILFAALISVLLLPLVGWLERRKLTSTSASTPPSSISAIAST